MPNLFQEGFNEDQINDGMRVLGFGLSGLIFNIIGIGFETFLESINLSVMVRLVGFVCVCLGFVLAVNVF